MSKQTIQIVSDSVEKTFEIGKRIGSLLEGGKVVCLVGALGSGKTTLIKGIAAGAGAARPEIVNSPTFVIVNEYKGRSASTARLDSASSRGWTKRGEFNIFHIDAYRINTIAEFETLGFEDFLGPDSVVLIEWADKVAQALEGMDCIHIEMRHNGEESRIIRLYGLENTQALKF